MPLPVHPRTVPALRIAAAGPLYEKRSHPKRSRSIGLTHLDQNAALSAAIDLHWCLTLEPPKLKAFEPQARRKHSIGQFADARRSYRRQPRYSKRNLGNSILAFVCFDKQQRIPVLQLPLQSSGLGRMGDQLRSDDRRRTARPLKNPSSRGTSDHPRSRPASFVQMFSHPGHAGGVAARASSPILLTLDCDSILCSTWRAEVDGVGAAGDRPAGESSSPSSRSACCHARHEPVRDTWIVRNRGWSEGREQRRG